MSRYILLSRVKVQSANMYTNGLLLGGAPLMAAAMFSHDIARKIKTNDEGFIYIHHDMQKLGGQAYGRFTPAQRRGATFIGKNDYSSKNKNALSLQPTASCHLEFSLIIKVETNQVKVEMLKKALSSGRFAGGQIISIDDISTHDEDDLELVLIKIKSGFTLLDRKDLLIKYQKEKNLNRIQAFTQLLALKTDALKVVFNDDSISWLSATNVGYSLLEEPTDERSGIRQADNQETTLHAYAEPLSGIVQYFSLNTILDKTTDADDTTWHDLEKLLWKYEWLQDDVFVLQQNSSN